MLLPPTVLNDVPRFEDFKTPPHSGARHSLFFCQSHLVGRPSREIRFEDRVDNRNHLDGFLEGHLGQQILGSGANDAERSIPYELADCLMRHWSIRHFAFSFFAKIWAAFDFSCERGVAGLVLLVMAKEEL